MSRPSRDGISSLLYFIFPFRENMGVMSELRYSLDVVKLVSMVDKFVEILPVVAASELPLGKAISNDEVSAAVSQHEWKSRSHG
jgi:hypothetical protein